MNDASVALIPRPPEKTLVRLAVLALIGAAIAIAFSPIFVRLSDAGPTATGFYRTALGLPLLIGWCGLERRRSGPARLTRRDWGLLWIAGFCFAGDLITWHWAIRLTSVSNSTLLANLAPIFVTLGAALLFGERVSVGFVLALVGALTGSAILAGGGTGLGRPGDALAAVTALFYGGYLLAISRLRLRLGVAITMTWTAAIASLFLLPTAILSGDILVPSGTTGWLAVVGLAMVSQVAGQSLIGWSLAHLPASYSSVSLLLQPVIATFLAWGILNEPPGWRQFLGGAVILASIVAARQASRSAARLEPALSEEKLS